MKLTFLLIPLLLLSSCMNGWWRGASQQEDKNYYESLYIQCMKLEKWEKWGCVTSVEWMEKNNFKEAVNGECPPGTTWNMNKTMGSKKWCEPKPSLVWSGTESTKDSGTDTNCKNTGCSVWESCTSIMYKCTDGSGVTTRCESYQCVKQ